MIATTDAISRTTTYGYDDLGRRIWVTDFQGKTNWTCYDALGRVVRTVQNATGDGATSTTDPCSDSYDPPDIPGYDHIYTTTYDIAGNIIATVDPQERITRMYYDDANRQIAVVRNLSNWEIENASPPPAALRTAIENLTSETSYDDNGNVLRTFDQSGLVTYYCYDELDRVVKTVSNPSVSNPCIPYTPSTASDEDITNQTFYDANSNVIATTNPLSVTTRTYYDDLNRPYLVVQNVAASYIYTSTLPVCNQGEGAETNICSETVYDENSNIIATIDPEGRITRTYYDELNRPYLVVQNLDPDWGYEFPEPPPCDPSNTDMDICTKTIYDGNGNVIATIDPLEKITRTYYDALNRPYMVIQN